MADETIIIDLSTARLADLPAMAGKAFAWWLGELKSLLPRWASRALPKPIEPAVMWARGDVWRLAPADGSAPAIELDPRESDKDLADRLLHAAPSFSVARPTVVLPRETVLRRSLELPNMPDAHVRSAVELQLDRLTPFAASTVRFDTRTLERDAVENKMRVALAIARREPVEAIERRLGALGLKPGAIDIDTPNGGREGFDLSARETGTATRRGTLITAALAGAAVVLWFLAIYAWGASRASEIASWQAAIAEVRPQAERSAALRRQFDALAEPLTIARTHKTGEILGILAELTRILPDTARLTELRINGPDIEFAGVATESPSLIGKLEASKLFKDVKFRAPVIRRPETNMDRIEIAMKREGEGAP